MIEPDLMLRVTAFLLGGWGVLAALQWFADLPRWQDGGPLGWELQRLRRGRIVRLASLGNLVGHAGLLRLASIQLVASAILLATPWQVLGLLALGPFAFATGMLAWRKGADGSDKMALVVAGGTLIQTAGFYAGENQLLLAGQLWIGGQLTIAYFAAGASKVLRSPWRNGDAMTAALSSYMWGHRWSAAVVKTPGVGLILAWLLMLAEMLFPLALLAPTQGLAATLAGFFLLHIAISIVMGLNTYAWAFLAAYPSVLLVGQSLRMWLGMN